MNAKKGVYVAVGAAVLSMAVLVLSRPGGAADPKALLSQAEAAKEKVASADLVKAELVADAESAAVGKPFTIGVLLTIKPGWHVYWKNPGDAGMATSVEFVLPDGYTAGPLLWPRPVTFKQPGDIVGYGYEKQVLLTAVVTPPKNPKPGELKLSADVQWLACKDTCIPGAARPERTLNIVADARDAKPANTELFKTWAARVAPPAPPFTLKDQDGKTVSLNDFRDEIVVLEWFNPDCPFTKRHHVAKKTMVDLANKYQGKGVVWLAINSTHYMDAAACKKAHDAWKLPYRVLVDQDGTVGRAYGAKTTPDMFIIADGRIVYRGAIDDDPRGREETPANYVDQALTELLADKPVSTPQTKPYGCSVKYAPKGK